MTKQRHREWNALPLLDHALGLGVLAIERGTIKRGAWESIMQRAAREFGYSPR